MHEEQQPFNEEMNELQPIVSDISVNDQVAESTDESLTAGTAMAGMYTILGTDNLYRRFPIVNDPKYISFWKEVDGRKVPTSAVFKTKQHEDGLSVDIEALTTQKHSVGDPLVFNLSALPASVPLSLGKECQHNPVEGNHAHALIMGDTTRIAKKLQASATVILL